MSDHSASLTTRLTARPRSATLGGVLALVLTGIALAFGAFGALRSVTQTHGTSGAGQVMILLIDAIILVGFIASIRALQNSNAGRITAASLGLSATVIACLIFLGTLASQTAPTAHHRAPVAVVLISLGWAAISGTSAVLLLTPRAHGWYARPTDTPSLVVPAGFTAPTHPRATRIVVLGTIGIVAAFAGGVLGPVFGILAWSMASSALREIEETGTRYADEGTLRAGRVLGIIATALSLIFMGTVVVVSVVLGVHDHHESTPGHTGISVLPAPAL